MRKTKNFRIRKGGNKRTMKKRGGVFMIPSVAKSVYFIQTDYMSNADITKEIKQLAPKNWSDYARLMIALKSTENTDSNYKMLIAKSFADGDDSPQFINIITNNDALTQSQKISALRMRMINKNLISKYAKKLSKGVIGVLSVPVDGVSLLGQGAVALGAAAAEVVQATGAATAAGVAATGMAARNKIGWATGTNKTRRDIKEANDNLDALSNQYIRTIVQEDPKIEHIIVKTQKMDAPAKCFMSTTFVIEYEIDGTVAVDRSKALNDYLFDNPDAGSKEIMEEYENNNNNFEVYYIPAPAPVPVPEATPSSGWKWGQGGKRKSTRRR